MTVAGDSWEQKRIRLRIFTYGQLVRGGRRLRLPLTANWPWAADISAAHAPCTHSHLADQLQPPSGQEREHQDP
jgi:hypothetical protein